MSDAPSSLQRFVAVVPVKPPAHGKSRLVGLSDEARQSLAAAFALDTVLACARSASVAEVLVVTDDAAFSSRLAALGTQCLPDGASGDLNATLRQAVAEARRRWPQLAPVALCADLPALLAADLDAALGSVDLDRPAFVADAAGVGTTLYTAAYDAFAPRFGGGSRAAHLGAGATPVEGDLRSLRRDVDDLTDLADARTLGVGLHTHAAISTLGL